jgi:hypothetical protein
MLLRGNSVLTNPNPQFNTSAFGIGMDFSFSVILEYTAFGIRNRNKMILSKYYRLFLFVLYFQAYKWFVGLCF